MNFSTNTRSSAEGGLRLGARARETFRDFRLRMRDPHALAAAAGRGLDHHRIADLVGDLRRVPLDPRSRRGSRARSRLSPQPRTSSIRSCRRSPRSAHVRPDEDDAGGSGLGEVGAFAEKSVAGMHGFRAGRFGRRQGCDRWRGRLRAGGGPMCTASSASRTCSASASASE